MASVVERNEEICRLYVSGLSIYDLRDQFKVSHETIRQILRRAGVFKKDRHVEASERDVFLGVNVTDAVKTALREEAEKNGMSMSELSSDAIIAMLRDRGHTLEADELQGKTQ